MSKRLPYHSLPEEIQSGVPEGTFHKANQAGVSTIVIRTTDHESQVWKKHGKVWELEQTIRRDDYKNQNQKLPKAQEERH